MAGREIDRMWFCDDARLNVGKLLFYTFGSKRRLEAGILVVKRDLHERVEFGMEGELANTAFVPLTRSQTCIHPSPSIRTTLLAHMVAEVLVCIGYLSGPHTSGHRGHHGQASERRNPFSLFPMFSCLLYVFLLCVSLHPIPIRLSHSDMVQHTIYIYAGVRLV